MGWVSGWLRWWWWRGEGGGPPEVGPPAGTWRAAAARRTWEAAGSRRVWEEAAAARRTWEAAGSRRVWEEAAAARRTWEAHGGDPMGLVQNAIEEEAGFSGLVFDVDLSRLREVAAGARVASCVVTAPAGVTATGAGPDATGRKAQATFACDAPGDYDVKFTCTLTPAGVVVRTGRLRVV